MARRKRRGRPVHGLLLLDKPVGMTSNAALQRVKQLFNAAKAGHTGSLDPLASGMLPLCFGEATKFSQFLLDADKGYTVGDKLGERKETADADGAVIETRPVKVSSRQLEKAVRQFEGDIEQVPSMYSAIKHKGQPLYKLARQGIEVEREPRPVTIHELEILSFAAPYFKLRVACSKGTYVRNLVEDIGEVLGCGAHVTELRRDWVGGFEDEPMVDMETLEGLYAERDFAALNELLMPADAMVDHWPSVELDEDMTAWVLQGQPMLIPKAPVEGWVRLYGPDERFLGVGEIMDDGRVAPRRLVAQEGL